MTTTAAGRTVCRLVCLKDFRQPHALQQLSAKSANGSATFPGCCVQQQGLQQRGVITVPVQNGKVARAMRALSRTVHADNLHKLWRDKQVCTRLAVVRVFIVALFASCAAHTHHVMS